jgi:hypothetical protein
MKSELVELYLSGGRNASASDASGALRLAARGYTFTMTGGAGR